jgi:tetratricopeptide (TPR) repeat protein
MTQAQYKCGSTILMFTLAIIFSLPVISGEASSERGPDSHNINATAGDNNPLDISRIKLGRAFDDYRKGDLDSARRELNAAIEWLRNATQTSKTEKVRDEAQKLSVEIEAFEKDLNNAAAGKESDLARFWHRVTSIIKRETNQLIHSYVELSIAEKTLKHLLDAKLHFFNAEHELFVSYDAEEAGEELNKTIQYLDEAIEVARYSIREQVVLIKKDVELLKDEISTTKNIRANNSLIVTLDNLLEGLEEVNEDIPPNLELRLDQIKADVRALRSEVGRNSVKNKYDKIMRELHKVINQL